MNARRLPWIVAGVAGLALAGVLLFPRVASATHPDPRPGITAAGVLSEDAMPNTPGAADAYQAARAFPSVLDGLYCYCRCKETAGHRSLLTCFESAHGAYCDICMNEAMQAVQMSMNGSSLEEIRKAIDQRFKS